MSNLRVAGPLCRLMSMIGIDPGTLCRSESPRPGPIGARVDSQGNESSHSPVSAQAETSATKRTYVLIISEAMVYGKKKFVNSNGDTECVEFVRQAAGAPQTSVWKRGPQIKLIHRKDLPRGTSIATFDSDGKYPTDDKGRHAAIYLSHDDVGIQVLDQWNAQEEVRQRLIRFNRDASVSRSNNGDSFHVIEG